MSELSVSKQPLWDGIWMGVSNLSLWDQWALTVYGIEAEYPPNLDWISLVTESMPGHE